MSVSPHEIPIVRRLYPTVVGALLGVSFTYALAFMLLISYGWREYRQAERVVAINYAIDDLMRVTQHARSECEKVVLLLARVELIGQADQQSIDSRRKNIDSTMRSAVSVISSQDIPGAEEILNRVQGLYSVLQEKYITTNAALSKPPAERPPKLADTLIEATQQLLVNIEELSNISAREAVFSNNVVGHLLYAKLMVWKLRRVASAEISTLESIIKRVQMPTRQEVESMVASAARTALAWEYLSHAAGGFQDSQFNSALTAARSGYFEDFVRVRDHLLQTAQKGKSLDAGREAYLAVSIRAMEAIGNVLDSAMELADRQASINRDKARNHLITLTGALIAGLMLLGLIFLAVRWRAVAALKFTGIARDMSAQKSAEQALSDQIVLMSTLLETIPGMIFIKDPEGRYLGCNRAYEELIGIDREVLKGRTQLDVFALLPADREALHAEELEVMRGKGCRHAHRQIRCADGSPRDFLYSLTSFDLSDGRAGGVVGVMVDVTERKRLEEQITDRKHIEAALRESEERFRQFSESINVGFWILDLNPRRVIYVNPAFTRMSGLKADEVYRNPGPGIDVVHEDDRLTVKHAFEEWLQGDPSSCLGIDYRIVRPDGKTRWIHDHGVKLQNESGGTFRILGISEDITDRKLAEEEARQTRAFMESIIENIPNMIFVKDAKELRFVQFNKAGEELLGYSRDALVGKNDYDFFPRSEADFFTMKDRQALNAGVMMDIPEEPVQTRLKGLRYLHTIKIPILDKTGQPRYLLGISEDITDHKRTHEAMKAMNRALERKAGELVTVNQELEAFAYSVSHDLRAPLRHIDGYINLLRKRTGSILDETSRRYMETISSAAARMACLIDDLLAFSRMGRKELKKTAVPLERLIRNVINDLKTEAESRHIDWVVNPLPSVFGDAVLFRQVFFNLLDNAVKYTRPRDLARIEIDCVQHDNEEAVIAVYDNGVGFDMRYVDKLFGVFQRLHRAEEFEGTGIGLANVARIIQRHGGRVWAVGEKDKGAAFYVAIPLGERIGHD